MENDFHWHGVAPSDQDTKLALAELKNLPILSFTRMII